jgi:hypothetical protein
MQMRNRTLKLLYRLRFRNSHFRNSIASASYVKLLSQNRPVEPTVRANVPATATFSFRSRVVGLYFGYGGWGATRTLTTARVDGLPSAGCVFLSPLIICFYEGFIVYEVLFDQLLVYLTTTVHPSSLVQSDKCSSLRGCTVRCSRCMFMFAAI